MLCASLELGTSVSSTCILREVGGERSSKGKLMRDKDGPLRSRWKDAAQEKTHTNALRCMHTTCACAHTVPSLGCLGSDVESPECRQEGYAGR